MIQTPPEFKEIAKQYGPYVVEMKKKLIRFGYLFVACLLVSFTFVGPLFKYCLQRFGIPDVQIVVASPFQFFSAAFDVALFIAIVVTFPIAVAMLFSFIKSALTKKERTLLKKMAVASLFLFFFGLLFGLGVMYYAVVFLAGFNANLGLANMWNMGLFMSQLLLAAGMLGLCFQYPVILTLLIRWGFLDVDTLRKKRRWAFLAVVVVASILPPPDVLATVIMIVPLLLMYEITIIINRKHGAKVVEMPMQEAAITNNINSKKYV